MNIEDCDELSDALPTGFTSLNDTCETTNTNVNGPKPYDHVMYRTANTTVSEMPRTLQITSLVDAMATSWPLRHIGQYPGSPYNHNAFRVVYSDHNPISFRLIPVSDDD